jgi:hypothetical protein
LHPKLFDLTSRYSFIDEVKTDIIKGRTLVSPNQRSDVMTNLDELSEIRNSLKNIKETLGKYRVEVQDTVNR